MIKVITSIFFSLFLYGIINAHNPALASFDLFQNKGQWELRAEFAWSLRNAIIKKYPFLEERNASQDEYLDCTLDYLALNIEITLDNQPLLFKQIVQLPGDHGHEYLFMIKLVGPITGKTIEFRNQCLFEIYAKAKHHFRFGNEECIITSMQKECMFVNDE